jgi:enamine deaminase RidA (YjgF/YER057c/UK114 family)
MSERIAPKGMAVPVGQYSHAIKVSSKQLVFVAGQVPIDKDGNVVGVDRSETLMNHHTSTLRLRCGKPFST